MESHQLQHQSKKRSNLHMTMVLPSTKGYRRILSSSTITPLILLPLLLFGLANSFSTTTTIDTSSSSLPIIRLLPDGSANDVLCSLLLQQQQRHTNNDEDEDEPSRHSPILVLEGFISKRRAIGKHLIFLDVMPVDTVPTLETSSLKKKVATSDGEGSLLSEIVPVQAIMRRDFWNGIHNQTNNNNNNNNTCSSVSTFDVYHKIIQPGTYCRIQGQVGPSRNQNEAILFCNSITYTLANNNPQHLRNVLKFVHDGVLDGKEVLDALPILSHVEELTPSSSVFNNNQTYGELAMEIINRFPRQFLMDPSLLMGSSGSAKVQLLPPVPIEFCTPPPQIDATSGSVVTEKTISQALQDRIDNNEQMNQTPITITGWIQNRRRYQDKVSVLEVVDEFSSLASSTTSSSIDTEEEEEGSSANNNELDMRNSKLKDLWKQRIYAVLHPSTLGAASIQYDDLSNVVETADIYGNILSSGARVSMQGFMMSSSENDDSNDNESSAATFWVTKCRLLRSSWRPGDIRQLLDLLHERKFDVEEAAGALEISYSQVEDLVGGTSSAAERQWLAAEVTQSLQGENSRVGKISSAMMQSLTTFATARDDYPFQDIATFNNRSDNDDRSQNAASILESNEGGNPRRTSLEGSRWQHKKRPQLEFMVEQIATVLRSHPDYGKRKLNVVDIGGGKGLLSNLLAETFGEDVVQVQVIDISRSATANGMMRAKRRGLENVRFDAMDATKVDVQSNKDVVVALHACGALSDVGEYDLCV